MSFRIASGIAAGGRVGTLLAKPGLRLRQTSTFEKVIVANSLIILLDTAAGWWVTQHDPETYHYLIDTTFIAVAAVAGMVVNFLLLRAAFAPLHNVLRTIYRIQSGEWTARAEARESDADALALAGAFNAMLDRLEHERLAASGRILRAQEAERRRIALELHDETGQSLTALALHAAAISQGLQRERGAAATQARQQAERLQTLAERTLLEVQLLARQLRPPLLDDLGLVAALRWLADDAVERLHTTVHVRTSGEAEHGSLDGQPRWLPSEAETALFRIAQESLTNAVRHGHARDVWISLRRTPAHVTLTVLDNGRGFASATTSPRDAEQRISWPVQGVGIVGMRERAHLIGGTLKLRASAGRGCAVRVVIPLRASAASPAALASATPASDASEDER